MQSKRILVTGGAGFIGSHLADTLIKRHQVVVLDNLSVGDKANLTGFLKNNGKLIIGDIRDEVAVSRAMKDVDMVFHLAVQCVRLSFKDPLLVHSVNTSGTLTLLEAAQKRQIQRFIYVSSSEIYGSLKSKNSISETAATCPTTIYGASKLAGEYYSLSYFRSYNLPVIVVRPFNSYGPRAHFAGVYGEVIPKFFTRLINNQPPIIYGDGKQTRDFTYITDTVDGIIRAGFSKKTRGEIVNIGSNQETSINKLADVIGKTCQINIPPIYRTARPADVSRLQANISKAKQLFNYQPQVDLATGLGRYYSWLIRTGFDFKKALKEDQEENWK